MTLFEATFMAGAILLCLGIAIFRNGSAIGAAASALARSDWASALLFGSAALWFLARLSTMKAADLVFFESPLPVVLGFGLLAVLAYTHVRDFLAVRGLCIASLLGAEQLLGAAYGQYAHPQRLLMVTAVYIGICLSLYLAVAPYRLKDFIEWLFLRRARTRWLGGILLLYGTATTAAAFTY